MHGQQNNKSVKCFLLLLLLLLLLFIFHSLDSRITAVSL